MSERNTHSDNNFIPEGLEFREEYMHAALSNYRRKKRAILWSKIGVAAVLLIATSTVLLVLWDKSNRNEKAQEQLNSANEQVRISNDSSSTIDLENDEGTFNKHRQSPAVESLEATQDLSTKAVDEGDPMSSGVGLPGQLSTSEGKLKVKAQSSSSAVSPFNSVKADKEFAVGNYNDNQVILPEPPESQPLQLTNPPSDINYLPFRLFLPEGQLQPHRSIPQAPDRRWGVHASLGAKLWADYGFGSGPAQPDPVMGMGVTYKWRKRITYQLAGQFFAVSGVAAPYVSTLRQYGEGFSETTHSYHTERFYHAGISIGAAYRITIKHSIGIFAESTVLLTADNRIETGTSTSYESRTTNEVKARGYVQGYRGVQHSLGIAYEYALGRNKSLGASYRHGLTDITINSFFGNEVDRNSMLSLYFKLKLTR